MEEADVHLLLLPLLSIWFPLLQGALSSQVLNHPSSSCSEWQQVPKSSLPLTHQFKHITGLSLSPVPTPPQDLQSQLQQGWGCCSQHWGFFFPSGLCWHEGLHTLWHLPSMLRKGKKALCHALGKKPQGSPTVSEMCPQHPQSQTHWHTQGHTRHLLGSFASYLLCKLRFGN